MSYLNKIIENLDKQATPDISLNVSALETIYAFFRDRYDEDGDSYDLDRLGAIGDTLSAMYIELEKRGILV